MKITVTTSRQRARDVLAEELVRQLEDVRAAIEKERDEIAALARERDAVERDYKRVAAQLTQWQDEVRYSERVAEAGAFKLAQAEQHAAQLVRVICEDAERIASHRDAIERLLAALNSNEATYTCPAIDCYFVVGGTAATLADWIAKHVNWTGHDVGMIQPRQPVTVSQEALLSAIGPLSAIGEPS